MSDRDRSSPSLTDTPLKTYIGRHDDDYPLINGNGECFLYLSCEGSKVRSAAARSQCSGLGARHALARAAARPRARVPATGSAARCARSAKLSVRCSLLGTRCSAGCGSPHTISFAALKLPRSDRPAPLWPLPEKRKLTYSSR